MKNHSPRKLGLIVGDNLIIYNDRYPVKDAHYIVDWKTVTKEEIVDAIMQDYTQVNPEPPKRA